jgi:hypothetical protein
MKFDNHFIGLSFQLEKQMNRLRLPSNENEIPVVKHEIKLNGILDVALLSTLNLLKRVASTKAQSFGNLIKME